MPRKDLIQVRRGSTAAWELSNPILAYGEPGYDEELDVFKLGDGILEWDDLPPMSVQSLFDLSDVDLTGAAPGMVLGTVDGINWTPVEDGAGTGVVVSIVAGDNIEVDSTDPSNPIVSATGGASGTSVNNIDPVDGNVTLDAGDVGADPAGSAAAAQAAAATDATAKANAAIDNLDTIGLPDAVYTPSGGTSTVDGGAIRNGRLIEVNWDYDQEEPPATDSLIGTAFHVNWNTDVLSSSDSASTQTGFFGPRGVFNLEGRVRYQKSQNQYNFAPVGYGDFLIVTNTPEANRILVPSWSFLSARFYGAIGGRTVTHGANDTTSGSGNFVDSTVYYTSGGSTWDGASGEHAGFYTGVAIQGNVHLAKRIGLRVNDIFGPADPTGAAAILSDVLDETVDTAAAIIDENIGIEIVRLGGGVRNLGIRNASATIETPAAVTISSAAQVMPIDVTEIQFTSATSYLMTAAIPAGLVGQRLRLTNVGTKPITWPTIGIVNIVKVNPGESRALTYTSAGWVVIGDRTPQLQNMSTSSNVDDGVDVVHAASEVATITATVPRFAAWDFRPLKIRQTGSKQVIIAAGSNVLFQVPTGKTAMTNGNNTEVTLQPTGTFGAILIYQLGGDLAPIEVVVAKTADFTFALTDVDRTLEVNAAGAVAATVPTNTSVAYATGSRVRVRQIGAGAVTLTPADGTVTITGVLTTSSQWSTLLLTKRGTNSWTSVEEVGFDPRNADNLNAGTVADARIASTIARDSEVTAAISALSTVYQPLDTDLTTLGGLTATTDNVIQSVAGAWASRTPAQVKATLALIKADVGLSNVDNTSDVNKPVSTAQAAADALAVPKSLYDANTVLAATTDDTPAPITMAASTILARLGSGNIVAATTTQIRTLLALTIGTDVQAYDADLTTLAGLTPTTDNFIVSVASAWASRTPAQVKTTLALDNVTNTSDANKPVSTAQQTALNLKTNRIATVGTALATTGTIDLDMSVVNDTYQAITLTGNPTFTTSNRVAGTSVTLKLSAGGSTRTIAWPAWIAVGAALPTSLASGKVLICTVTFFDTTDAAAVASAAVQL